MPRPPGSSKATHRSNGSKYEDATESSLYTSTGTSRSSSPSSSGNCRGVNELAGASRKKKNHRKQRTQQEHLDIDTDAFLSVCKFAEERYSHDALVQLQHCTDYIFTAFRGSEIPFSKLVLEQALEKVIGPELSAMTWSAKQLIASCHSHRGSLCKNGILRQFYKVFADLESTLNQAVKKKLLCPVWCNSLNTGL